MVVGFQGQIFLDNATIIAQNLESVMLEGYLVKK